MKSASLSTIVRILAKIAKGLLHTHHPVLVRVQQVGYMDNWRRPQRGVARLPAQAAHAEPAAPGS